jgi:hypothetical protein
VRPGALVQVFWCLVYVEIDKMIEELDKKQVLTRDLSYASDERTQGRPHVSQDWVASGLRGSILLQGNQGSFP